MAIRDPSGYPWPTPLRRGVIGPQGWREELWEHGRRVGRLPVLAVGSNASPAVLVDKLGALLGETGDAVYLEVCQVAGLAVGHSAHLSPPGFMAAAPFRLTPAGSRSTTPADLATTRERTDQDDAGSAYSLAWLTQAQARALDATEPNYERRPLCADVIASSEPTSEPIEEVTLYVSRHGVLAESGQPVPLMPQPQALAWLHERLGALKGVPDDVVFADPDIRESVRAELARGGWVAPSGL